MSTLGCAAFHITAITEHRYPGTFLCCGLHHLLAQEQPINILSNLLSVPLNAERYSGHSVSRVTIRPVYYIFYILLFNLLLETYETFGWYFMNSLSSTGTVYYIAGKLSYFVNFKLAC